MDRLSSVHHKPPDIRKRLINWGTLLRLQIDILFFTGKHANSRGLECEMGQFHWTVDIFQSETILAEFLIRKCELEGGIVSSIIIDRHWLFLSKKPDVYKNVRKICGLMKNKCWISRIQYGSLFKLEQYITTRQLWT